MNDLHRTQQQTRRMRDALARLQHARNYQQQAARMVREAEAAVRAAIQDAMPPAGGDGERRAA
jgi:hypothetical protein